MGSRARHPIRRFIRVVVFGVVVLLLLPFGLAVLYAVVAPVSTLMLWRYATGQRVERVWVPLDQMAPALVRAVIVAEDARYCRHHGVDFRGVAEAIEEADSLRDARGGSSITQQTAKNLFLWPSHSFVRKALEFPLALWLDLVLGKRRVLEIYLNSAQWGPAGEFGAEAGARRAFGKSVADLEPHEAALLAATLPNPRRRDAGRPGPGLRRLAGIYQARAAAAGGITACVFRRTLASI
jgi:monofunctional biosynthetic peptidoglycan transglycosylase